MARKAEPQKKYEPLADDTVSARAFPYSEDRLRAMASSLDRISYPEDVKRQRERRYLRALRQIDRAFCGGRS